MKVSLQRAREITARFSNHTIAVMGDLMLDRFIWGEVSRISPEAPVPVVEVQRESAHLGGAGNVANNLHALGAQVIPFGVIGADASGSEIRSMFHSTGLRDDGMVEIPGRPTTTKTRVVAHNQQVVRADWEDRSQIGEQAEDRLLELLVRMLPSVQAIILSDYNKGVLTPRVLEHSIAAAREASIPVIVDPKIQHFLFYRGATVITPNHHEAALLAGIGTRTNDELRRAAERIQRDFEGGDVLVTRGDQGMTLMTRDQAVHHIPTVAQEVYDVTGAGDTVVAALALALASGASMLESAVCANHAAGVVVGKVGTATLTAEELIEQIEGQYRGNAQRIEAP